MFPEIFQLCAIVHTWVQEHTLQVFASCLFILLYFLKVFCWCCWCCVQETICYNFDVVLTYLCKCFSIVQTSFHFHQHLPSLCLYSSLDLEEMKVCFIWRKLVMCLSICLNVSWILYCMLQNDTNSMIENYHFAGKMIEIWRR